MPQAPGYRESHKAGGLSCAVWAVKRTAAYTARTGVSVTPGLRIMWDRFLFWDILGYRVPVFFGNGRLCEMGE